MRTRLAGKLLVVILGLGLLWTLPGCGQAIVSPIDRLATLRPVLTPAIGGGEDPFVPVSAEGTGSPGEPTPIPPPNQYTATSTALPPRTSQEAAAQTAESKNAPQPTPRPPILYYTQAGDTLDALAIRYNVRVEEISSPDTIPAAGFIDPGKLLLIPQRLENVSNSEHIIPDSEIVYSPSALEFDIGPFIDQAGGYLAGYKEWRANGRDDAANTITLVSLENSINPRLLLAVLEYQSGWVYGQPRSLALTDYPMGHIEFRRRGLYFQLSWAVQMLNIGYYGWRDGRITSLTFTDGQRLRLAPDLNAGSVAVMYLFSQLYDLPNWAATMYGDASLPALYTKMFGSPWERALTVEPLFPATLSQPEFQLPFRPGKPWSFTGGPHSAWGKDGALAALDFAPSSTEHKCYQSQDYVTAIAAGLVVRTDTGVVVVDLDGDGYEQTGWAILYLHIATQDKVAVGTWLNTDDRVGHPSCEGGTSTGTHVHIARKYNGEWIQADGPLPFVLSGWRVYRGAEPYEGRLVKDGITVEASVFGEYKSLISR